MNEPKGHPRDDRVERPMCRRCRRPASVCYCEALTTIKTRTRVVILQHPRERGMPIGTAHMATLCLPQAELHVGTDWDESAVFEEVLSDLGRPAILLYPGPEAGDILLDPPSGPVTLIMVDGTWAQARSMVRHNPRLATLPRYAFHAPEPSNYRIRREPRAEYVSTLEALVHVLGVLEGEPERFRALLEPMNAMVDAQIARAAESTVPRRARPRVVRTPAERLPAAIFDRYEDLVLVFADANAWPWSTPEHALGDELVYWVAVRPSSGETFASILAPRHPLSPAAPHHTELSKENLLAGVTPEAMLAAFSAFVRPRDVIGSWGHHGLRMFQDLGGVLPGTFLDLREAARVFTNRKNGRLEQYAAEAAAPQGKAVPAGRAGRRLGLLLDILEAWRLLAKSAPVQ